MPLTLFSLTLDFKDIHGHKNNHRFIPISLSYPFQCAEVERPKQGGKYALKPLLGFFFCQKGLVGSEIQSNAKRMDCHLDLLALNTTETKTVLRIQTERRLHQ